MGMKALAVFGNHGGHPLGWLLHRDFKHVFVVVCAGDYWIKVDARTGVPDVAVVAGADYDLRQFYCEQGYHVVALEQSAGIRGPLVIANCVGLAKAVLGIEAPFVWSPRQLYRFLIRRQP